MTFDRPVTVTGTPPLELSFGLDVNFSPHTRNLDYAAGSGTKALVFRYTLVHGDLSSSFVISVGEDKLTLPGGATIRTGTADATLTHTGADSDKDVEALAPVINVAYTGAVPRRLPPPPATTSSRSGSRSTMPARPWPWTPRGRTPTCRSCWRSAPRTSR